MGDSKVEHEGTFTVSVEKRLVVPEQFHISLRLYFSDPMGQRRREYILWEASPKSFEQLIFQGAKLSYEKYVEFSIKEDKSE